MNKKIDFKIISLFLLSTIAGSNASEKENLIGFTLGGQQLFYDVQFEHEIDDSFSILGAFSYFGYQSTTNVGMQFDYSPFENWFGLSAGASAWKVSSDKPIFVPDFGSTFKFKGKNWSFKIRPSIFYQTSKNFLFPWIGFTLSKRV